MRQKISFRRITSDDVPNIMSVLAEHFLDDELGEVYHYTLTRPVGLVSFNIMHGKYLICVDGPSRTITAGVAVMVEE